MTVDTLEDSIIERIFEISPIGIVVLTPEGTITRANQRAETLLQLDDYNITGKTYDDPAWTFVDTEGEKLPEQDHPFQTVLESGPMYNERYRLRLAHATTINLSISGAPINNEEGTIERLVFTFQDISDQIQQEREHERQANRLKAFSIAFPDLAFIINEEGRYLDYFSGKHSETLLYEDPENFIGELTEDIFPTEIANEQLSRLQTAIETGDPVRYEYTLETPAGVRWFEAHIESLPFEIDGDEAVLLVARDITDRKHRERKLARQNERLDSFASIVSHDLRNPLSVAMGRMELLREESDSEQIDPITTALERMGRIIEDVLWLAREGQDIGDIETVDLNETVHDSWDMVSDDDAASELIISDGHEGNLAPIRADYDRLRQVLENLFRNAIEHGGEDVTVTVGRLESGFFVEDDGPGISEDEREEVFRAGYSTSDDGTGFGLHIVKQIVEAHGWDISAMEGSEGGTRFEITDVEIDNE